jgi:hypothetical protein
MIRAGWLQKNQLWIGKALFDDQNTLDKTLQTMVGDQYQIIENTRFPSSVDYAMVFVVGTMAFAIPTTVFGFWKMFLLLEHFFSPET